MNRRLFAAALLLCACTGKYVRETTNEEVKITNERLERGSYIVNNLAACTACHTGREDGSILKPVRADGNLAGGNSFLDNGMTIHVPNITNDPDTGIGAWSDDEVMRAIRDGVRPDGSFMFPIMPFGTYQYMSDEDVRSVVAYLRTVPAVKLPARTPATDLPFPLNLGVAMHEPARDVRAPGTKDRVKHGEYVARMGHCMECHSMSKTGPRKADDELYMAGSTVPFDSPDWGRIWARNLTPDLETGLGRYSADDIKAAFRAGRRLDGQPMGPPMSLFMSQWAGLADDDLDALVAYLKALEPVKHAVPERQLNDAGRSLLYSLPANAPTSSAN